MEHYFQNIEGWFDFPNFYRHLVKTYDNAIFVEVGSWQGKSSCFMGVEIITSRKNLQLHCVDTWEGSAEHQDKEIVQRGMLYDTFLQNIEPVKSVIKPVRKTSFQASMDYEDNSIAAVFLDGSHDYESVKLDISCWYPRIQPGGVLAGHDHTWPGVVKAVNEFLDATHLALHIIGFEDCWGLIKPGKRLPEPTPEGAALAIKAIGKL